MGASCRLLCILALTAVTLGGSVGHAQQQTLKPLANGGIQQGPFLLMGHDDGGLHLLKGSQVISLGAGIACGNGGYWPYDRVREKEVTLGNGTMALKFDVTRVGVSYEQQVSIQGSRIRIRLRRTGNWPGSHWEEFRFWLPMERYRGAQIRADGNLLTLPATYSEAGRNIVSGARRVECNVTDPSLNLLFECDRGIRLFDHRPGILRYVLAVGFPEAAGEYVDLYLTLPQVPEAATWAVRYSPVGYPVNGEKTVVLEWPKHLARPPDDSVRIERADGTVAAQGRFGQTVTLRHMQSGFATFDFSRVTEPGDYRAVWAGGAVQFPIRPSAFTDGLWEPTLDYFIPFQMCHARVDLGPNVTGHAQCHMDDAIRVPANFPGTDGFVAYECTGTPYKAGDAIPCARGGWHDAGDCDLNIYAQGFSTYVLALAYEEFGLDRDVATLDVVAQTFTAGRPDGTPDLLQQVEWGALWLLSMMQPDGRSYVGVVVQPQLRRSDILWEESTDNRPGTGDERHCYVDYHSELQCMQAAALCAASRVLKEARPELAQTCVQAARKAYAYFRTHEEVYRRTAYFYESTKGRDGNVAVALGELYMTTGDPAYLNDLEAMTDKIEKLDLNYPAKRESSGASFWYAPPVLARLAQRLPEGRLKAACVSTCRRAARFHADRLSGRPWAGHYTDFGKLGNTAAPHTRVFDAYWISKVAPDLVSLDKAVQPMLWTYGFHPFSNVAFVSDIGLDGPKHIFSIHLRRVFRPEMGTVPGAPVPGITAVRPYVPDNVLYYFDDGDVPNGECTIAEATLYVFAVNAMKKAGF